MKYEALYSAVLSAAPTVLIGYVLEIRWAISRFKSLPPRRLKWMLHVTVAGTSLSAVLSLIAFSETGIQDNRFYPLVVTLGLLFGITGLTAFLSQSYLGNLWSNPIGGSEQI